MPEPDSFIASILPYLPYALGGLAIASSFSFWAGPPPKRAFCFPAG